MAERGSSVENAARQLDVARKVVGMRARSRTWDAIASEVSLTPRRCRQIADEYAQTRPRLRERDPVLIIEEMLDRYEAAQEELSEIAADASNDAVRVGAINARMSAMRSATELMQATGILPNNLGKLRVELDVRVLAAKIVQVLESHDASEDLQTALLSAIDGTAEEA